MPKNPNKRQKTITDDKYQLLKNSLVFDFIFDFPFMKDY
jgi:hypothetical protein